jgi:hypothetical protein
MSPFPTANLFDDFLDGTWASAALDALAATFALTRGDGETDDALLARLETAAGVVVQGTERYWP